MLSDGRADHVSTNPLSTKKKETAAQAGWATIDATVPLKSGGKNAQMVMCNRKTIAAATILIPVRVGSRDGNPPGLYPPLLDNSDKSAIDDAPFP